MVILWGKNEILMFYWFYRLYFIFFIEEEMCKVLRILIFFMGVYIFLKSFFIFYLSDI